MEYIDIDLYGNRTTVIKSKGGRADVLPSVKQLVAHLRATRMYAQEWGEDEWHHDAHSGQLFLESGVRLRTLFEMTSRIFITASQEKLWDRVFDSAVSHIQYGSYK
jgi:hypothetical protein